MVFEILLEIKTVFKFLQRPVSYISEYYVEKKNRGRKTAQQGVVSPFPTYNKSAADKLKIYIQKREKSL